VCVSAAILIMIAVSAAAPEQAVSRATVSAAGPPWSPLSLHLSVVQVYVSLWTASVAGGAGVIAGLAAVARGARPSARLLVAGGLLAVAALAVLPPAGSSDTLDYAADGRIAALGYSPYVVTPQWLRARGDPIGKAAPVSWQTHVSAYGPLATGEEWAAAELGGTSMARTVFWLKLWNALAFGVVVLALDRLLRADPARRARAHLLWSVNPLLLWNLIAGGHIDGLAAAFGFLGVTALTVDRPGGSRSPARALAAGLLAGAAAGVKAPFGLFALGIAWAARRSRAALLPATAGGLAILVPATLLAGGASLAAVAHRGGSSGRDNLYQLFYRPLGSGGPPLGLTAVAGIVFAAVAVLAVRRLPDSLPGLPAVTPALALSLAWLLAWPYQQPWYDAMAVCLLALYPASRLDGVVLVRLLVATASAVPGFSIPGRHDPGWLGRIVQDNWSYVCPATRLAALAALVWLCVCTAHLSRPATPRGPARG